MIHDTMEKAKVVLEALPYIREFYGKWVVIKYGGHAMKDDHLKRAFALNVVLLKYIGLNPVIVHGGGPQIGQMLEQLNIASTFCQGQRVTDKATMDIVEMVLVGRVNKEIVNLINLNGGKAVGVSGKDGGLLQAKKLEIEVKDDDGFAQNVDLGCVGEIVEVRTDLIYSLEKEGFIPIIAPVGVGEEGETYNINADSVAGSVAAALGAKKLVLLTDVTGVLDEQGNRVRSLNEEQVDEAIESGLIKGGMIPKVRCCLHALKGGAQKAHILDGRLENSIILEMFTPTGIGTQIVH